MSDMKTVGIILIFVSVMTLFMYSVGEIFPEGGFNTTSTTEYTKPTSSVWDLFNPFTYIDPLYDIFTFEILGLPDDITTILQMVIYIPLAGIALLMALYYIRGN